MNPWWRTVLLAMAFGSSVLASTNSHPERLESLRWLTNAPAGFRVKFTYWAAGMTDGTYEVEWQPHCWRVRSAPNLEHFNANRFVSAAGLTPDHAWMNQGGKVETWTPGEPDARFGGIIRPKTHGPISQGVTLAQRLLNLGLVNEEPGKVTLSGGAFSYTNQVRHRTGTLLFMKSGALRGAKMEVTDRGAPKRSFEVVYYFKPDRFKEKFPGVIELSEDTILRERFDVHELELRPVVLPPAHFRLNDKTPQQL